MHVVLSNLVKWLLKSLKTNDRSKPHLAAYHLAISTQHWRSRNEIKLPLAERIYLVAHISMGGCKNELRSCATIPCMYVQAEGIEMRE